MMRARTDFHFDWVLVACVSGSATIAALAIIGLYAVFRYLGG